MTAFTRWSCPTRRTSASTSSSRPSYPSRPGRSHRPGLTSTLRVAWTWTGSRPASAAVPSTPCVIPDAPPPSSSLVLTDDPVLDCCGQRCGRVVSLQHVPAVPAFRDDQLLLGSRDARKQRLVCEAVVVVVRTDGDQRWHGEFGRDPLRPELAPGDRAGKVDD